MRSVINEVVHSGIFTLRATLLAVAAAGLLQAQPTRYAVYLEDAPVADQMESRAELQSPRARALRGQIEARQQTLRRDLAARNFAVTGSASTLLNAVFVSSSGNRIDELRAIPGVKGVVRLLPHHRALSKAVQLVNGPGTAAFNAAGALPNGGQGVKIAILDTGIDQNHPSLRDSGLEAPGGFAAVCDSKKPYACSNANFTNGKVIVARSYVVPLAAGTNPANPAADSRPDDYTPRDREGHGTAVATVAAGATSTGAITISGMAPRAWLGSYKIFGSPLVNDATYADIEISALEDAIADGMDIISISSGAFALNGPLDTGAACGLAAGLPCDPAAAAFEKAAQQGIVIVAAAGNEGYSGYISSGNSPTWNSITSPGNGPSLITVGGITNSHAMGTAVRVTGAGVPAALNNIFAVASDSQGNLIASIAPLSDAAQAGNDGYACQPLRSGSMTGKFALIQHSPPPQGPCTFQAKYNNATNAGAAGVVFYDYPGDADWPFVPDGLSAFTLPSVMIGNADGVALKNFLAARPGISVTLDPYGIELDVLDNGKPWNQLVGYSSAGPATGTNGLKPDVLAVAGGSGQADSVYGVYPDALYMGAQTWDPLGGQYSPTGYAAAAGTSFAAPLVSGAAAILKQNRPKYSAAQIKSAIVNTAAQDVTSDDYGNTLTILQTGGGKLAVDLALKTTVTVEPATISWGAIKTGSLPLRQQLKITNTGTAVATLTLAVVAGAGGTGSTLALDNNRLTLQPGASGNVTATLSGTVPAAGVYQGALSIGGGAVPVRVPWMFLVGSGQPADMLLLGDADITTGQATDIYFRITDAYGLAIAGLPVTFQIAPSVRVNNVNVNTVPVTLSQVSPTTDAWGWAHALLAAGTEAGRWGVQACRGTCTSGNVFQYRFSGAVTPVPSISAAGIVNAGSAAAGSAIAPGSYLAIYGANLTPSTAAATAVRLPLTLANMTVSFDVPSAGLSLPGRLTYAGPGQVNVQVPWELRGQTQVQIKTAFDVYAYSNVVTVPVADYAPAFFEIAPGTVAAIDPGNAANPLITLANPARRGTVISLYANGLGPVNNQPESGEPAGALQLASTKTAPVVTIGGQSAAVSFSGLTPGLPGLYQINVAVPAGTPTGNQPVTLTIGGQAAKASGIAVQ